MIRLVASKPVSKYASTTQDLHVGVARACRVMMKMQGRVDGFKSAGMPVSVSSAVAKLVRPASHQSAEKSCQALLCRL